MPSEFCVVIGSGAQARKLAGQELKAPLAPETGGLRLPTARVSDPRGHLQVIRGKLTGSVSLADGNVRTRSKWPSLAAAFQTRVPPQAPSSASQAACCRSGRHVPIPGCKQRPWFPSPSFFKQRARPLRTVKSNERAVTRTFPF